MTKPLTMRERLLAVIRGTPLDRVPFIMYDNLLPNEEVWKLLGRETIGLIRWSSAHRVETPHCAFETIELEREGKRWQRITLHTPKGDLYEERAFEPVYNSSSIRKHYVQAPEDFEVLWSYLNDGIVLENYGKYYQDDKELGDAGLPMVAVERSAYQQLWVQWVGLDTLGFHFMDYPDRVQHTIDLLNQRALRIFEIVSRSPAPFIDFPDNITAPPIGPKRFAEYCVPQYNLLADMIGDRNIPVFVHMDGDLKPLWKLIAESKVRGLDSFAPAPDNDTTVAQAAAMWPDKRLFVNFPSSVHLRPAEQVREEAERILEAAGHTGRLEIQLSENVPPYAWPTSLPAIAAAIQDFKP
ncbi:MAG: uroporphyrinogen decarboxylase family protein [Anaerolineae bacterium]